MYNELMIDHQPRGVKVIQNREEQNGVTAIHITAQSEDVVNLSGLTLSICELADCSQRCRKGGSA